MPHKANHYAINNASANNSQPSQAINGIGNLLGSMALGPDPSDDASFLTKLGLAKKYQQQTEGQRLQNLITGHRERAITQGEQGDTYDLSQLTNPQFADQLEKAKRLQELVPLEKRGLEIQNLAADKKRIADANAMDVLSNTFLAKRQPQDMSWWKQPTGVDDETAGQMPMPSLEKDPALLERLNQASKRGDKEEVSKIAKAMMGGEMTEGGSWEVGGVAPTRKVSTEDERMAASLQLFGPKNLTKHTVLTAKLKNEILAKDDALKRLEILSGEKVGLAGVAGKTKVGLAGVAGEVEVGLAEVLMKKEVGVDKNKVLEVVELDKNLQLKRAAVKEAELSLQAKQEEMQLIFGKGGSADRIATKKAELEAESKKLIAANAQLEETKRALKESIEQTKRSIEHSKQITLQKKEESDQKTIRAEAKNEVNKAIEKTKSENLLKGKKDENTMLKALGIDKNDMLEKVGLDKREKWLEAQKYATDNKKIAEGKSTSNTLRTKARDGKPVKGDTYSEKLAGESVKDSPSLIVTVDSGAEAEDNFFSADKPAREKVQYILPPVERRRLAKAHTQGRTGPDPANAADLAGITYLTEGIGRDPVEAIWLMWKQFNWSDKKRDDYLKVTNKQTLPVVE